MGDEFVTDKARQGALESISGRDRETALWSTGNDGLLRRRGLIYVPNSPAMRAELLATPVCGPLRARANPGATQRKYYWPGMERDVKNHLRTCEVCQRTKTKRHSPYGELTPFQPPTPGNLPEEGQKAPPKPL